MARHKSLFRLSLLAVSLFLFTATLLDVHRNLEFLSPSVVWLGILVSAAALVPATRGETHPLKRLATILLVGAIGALGCRALEQQSVVERSDEQWRQLQRATDERLASQVSSRFRDLCRGARLETRELSRASAVTMAAEGSDAEDYKTGAFEALAGVPLPQAHPRGPPGVTLYDARRRPLAWSGENISLASTFDRPYGVPESKLFVVEQGVYTYLVAVEPLLSHLGFVSVEIPLIADRRLENRYLEDYDAFSFWAGRSLDTELLRFGEDPGPLARRLSQKGERFWEHGEDGPRLFFALRDDEDHLLGLSSFAGEAPPMARIEARRGYALAASFVLVLAAGFALAASVSMGAPVPLLLALWGGRIVLGFTDVPLGLGLELDNPAYYASSLFFGLARSPIDFFLTAGALLASAVLVWRRWAGSRIHRFRWSTCFAGSLTSIFVLTGANDVVLDAWVNSSFALSTVNLLSSDAPQLVLQLGLVLLFVAATSFAALMVHVTTEGGRRAFAADAVAVATSYALLSRFGLGHQVLLSIVPLVAVRAVTFRWDALAARWASSGPYARLGTYGTFMILAVLSFYPALAHFQETTVRDFIETTVRPVVLQHDGSRTDAMLQTANAIDRMEAQGRLDLARSDIAYQIWIETGLGASSLSSSIEILDSTSRIVSRFALNYPLTPPEPEPEPAPPEWFLEDESLRSDPKHPGVRMARSIRGPDGKSWEIRVKLASDWKNLPFISTSNPYLNLFRTSGADTEFRFPYRELSLFVLEHDSTSVFQSTEGVVHLPEMILDQAMREPLWWEFSRDGATYEGHLFSDRHHIFVLSYPKTARLTYAVELASWALLSAALAAALLASWLVLGALGSPRGVSPSELWAAIGTSFSGKLYVAFILIALVPIILLAFLIRGLLMSQLQADVEKEGMSRARVVEKLVHEFPRSEPEATGGTRTEVTDALLERIGDLAAVDVDVYADGELVATSKPELFGSGLLRTRAVPSAYREIVLENRTHSIHRESVGSLEYLVVSVPIELKPRREPGILSLPLASREAEIERRVSALNQALLLAALGFSIAAVALAYSLARRIAEPINSLTDATHRVADGDLDVTLETSSKDEIGALFSSFIQMTAELKRQRSDLEKTKKLEAWAEMARQVAHEVKNPLTPIQLSAEHLLRVYTDPDVDFEAVLHECSETILQQVKTLRQISMEFSTFASPELLNPEPTDFAALVRETMEPYLAASPDGVLVELETAPEIPKLRVDRRLVKRTLLNLVENALHAVGGNGTIRIRVTPQSVNGSRFVEVTITDSGVGVEPELAQRIFEPYFSTRAAGTGLGLAIAKKVVEDHGGTIFLQSEPGKGTRVTVRLPVDTGL